MGILDRIIERGANKTPQEQINDKAQENNATQETTSALEVAQPETSAAPQTPAQEVSAPVQPAQVEPIAQEQQARAGFFGTFSSAASYTNQPLPPLKTYTGARKLGRTSFILSLIASICICSVCGLFALMWLLSITGASSGLGELFSEEANFMSGGLAGMVGVLGFLMMGVGVLLVLGLMFGFCYFPVYSTLKIKRKMVYPAGLYSLNGLSNIIIIAGNIVYFVLLVLLAGLVISNHGSPIIYIAMFAIGAMMLAVSILTIIDWVKSKKAYRELNEETKAEYYNEYQNIKAHERRKRRAREAKRSLWS